MDRYYLSEDESDGNSDSSQSAITSFCEERDILWCLSLLNHSLDLVDFARLIGTIETLHHPFLTICKSTFVVNFLHTMRNALQNEPAFVYNQRFYVQIMAISNFEAFCRFHSRRPVRPELEQFYRWVATQVFELKADPNQVLAEIAKITGHDHEASSSEKNVNPPAMKYYAPETDLAIPGNLTLFAEDSSNLTSIGMSIVSKIKSRFERVILYTTDKKLVGVYRATFDSSIQVTLCNNVGEVALALDDLVGQVESPPPFAKWCVVLDCDRNLPRTGTFYGLQQLGITVINLIHESAGRLTTTSNIGIGHVTHPTLETVYTKTLVGHPHVPSFGALEKLWKSHVYGRPGCCLIFSADLETPESFTAHVTVMATKE